MNSWFREITRGGHRALIPFLTAGWPSVRGTIDLARACVEGGADAIEIGVPFSDPLADGPVIQRASQEALRRGTTMVDVFKIAGALRGSVPVVVMTYWNPVLQYGARRFEREAERAGVRGLIVADLPPEEAGGWRGTLPLIYLCSPTCADARVRAIGRATREFIYAVSLKGITGVRRNLSPELPAFLRRVKRLTGKPICVGFGISRPEHAAVVRPLADGIIVGSAVLRTAEGGPRRVRSFIRVLRRALDSKV